MIKFGPAGNCERFYNEGFKVSEQAPGWVREQGLNAYEYAAGHGVALGEPKALAIGEAAKAACVTVSIHAPYYINCGNPDRKDSNLSYFLSSARAVRCMGGSRVIFHIGSPGKKRRDEAFDIALETIREARRLLDDNGLDSIMLCPETMGRPSQIGTLDEVIAVCRQIDRTLPTIDFGHLHVAQCGVLNSEADFENVITRLISELGFERMEHFHAHFSRIAFTAKGEKMHMTFADEGYGPDFAHLAPVLRKYRLEPTIICESRGTQADDALAMKAIYESLG